MLSLAQIKGLLDQHGHLWRAGNIERPRADSLQWLDRSRGWLKEVCRLVSFS